MVETPTMSYFGRPIVEKAVADYFSRNGLTEEIRDNLMLMAVHHEDDFFQMVDDFIMKGEA